MLYQPLTLLDCLHTFCGSCLKEWFSWQASQVSAQKPNPFTCPSCRASVRDTKPNAGVTTLLDMFLQANPSKGRSQEDRNDLNDKYKVGDPVLPKIRHKKESNDEAEDRRMVEEVREMSLRDVGIRASIPHERGGRHRIRENDRDRRSDHSRHLSLQRDESVADADSRPSTASDAVSQVRQIEHQSSLRSLLSASDVDSSEMEEEILKQIMDEGILDGIDLNNIDVSQEDELSERIAEAYRRRHEQRTRSRNYHSVMSSSRTPRGQRQGQGRQNRPPSRSPNPSEQDAHSSHPPVSRPRLLEVYPTNQGHRRRTSSETRRQTSPTPPSTNRRASPTTQRQAARSATDLSVRPENPPNVRVRPRDLSDRRRRTTDPESSHLQGPSRDRATQAPRIQAGLPREALSSDIASISSTTTPTPQRPSTDTISSVPRLSNTVHTPIVHQNHATRPVTTNPLRSSTDTLGPEPPFAEPSVSCERCQRRNIEFELHWNCVQCHEGTYNLCSDCYRTGRGCLHWFGFGFAATQKYRSQLTLENPPIEQSSPHRLEGHRYLRPPAASLHSSGPSSIAKSTSNPTQRLQSGPFCSNCSKFTPKCYWICEVCNDGEWGYCNSCVNQGKCCTHALLPLSSTDPRSLHDLQSPISSQRTSSEPRLSDPLLTVPPYPLGSAWAENFLPLTFSTKCDICTYPIPPSTTRFHCPHCNAGDYDIDSTCYHKLVHNGKISVENGPKGWRRCPSGHRMVVIGFEDSSIGQRRIVVEDLVGGHALKDDVNAKNRLDFSWPEGHERQAKTVSTAAIGRGVPSAENPADHRTPPLLKRYPPNGGIGMHVLALWAWWPQDGTADEFAFPRGAEIRECEDINGEWFWGVYCARKGVFPASYGRLIETVGMV